GRQDRVGWMWQSAASTSPSYCLPDGSQHWRSLETSASVTKVADEIERYRTPGNGQRRWNADDCASWRIVPERIRPDFERRCDVQHIRKERPAFHDAAQVRAGSSTNAARLLEQPLHFPFALPGVVGEGAILSVAS